MARNGLGGPRKKGGGWVSPVDLTMLHGVVGAACDATTEEITWEYNRRVGRGRRIHRSSILRALRRSGYVFKKNARGRRNRIMRTSTRNAPRGAVVVDPRPMNWGANLTMVEAMRVDEWVTIGTAWEAATAERFVAWVKDRLAPKLRVGDIVVMDNLAAHRDRRGRDLFEARGATLEFLPRYSCDLNPIEPAWALLKKRIRSVAPRTAAVLRATAQRAWHPIRPEHCRNWFAHAGCC